MPDEPIGTRRHLIGQFAVRTSIGENVPVRPLFDDLRGAQAFMVAIVPFGEVRLEPSERAEPSELTSSLGALTGAA
jgi:hypothetical protein